MTSHYDRWCIVYFEILIILLSAAFPVNAYINNTQIGENIENVHLTLDEKKVLILVDDSIYGSLEKELSIFAEDINNSGFESKIYHQKISYNHWGTPQQVKKFIKSHSTNLAGCIFVGHIPMAKYRCRGYMNENETFPCEYYYMDLDGHWDVFEDVSWYNGLFYTVFCNHTDGDGDVKPEIWVGRLTPDYQAGDKITQLKEYFKRNHEYRTMQMNRPTNALLYVDDPWINYVDTYKKYLNNIYPNSVITVVDDKEKTRGKNYLNKIKSDKYEWVELHAHSNSLQHLFYYNDGGNWDSLRVGELKNNYTGPLFYTLYACEALDFTSQCLGNVYIFGKTSGLVVIGSSKIGGFNDKGKNLYTKLGDGLCIGEAFKYYYDVRGVKYPSYCYGLTIFGDPTLKPIKDTTSPNINILVPKKNTIYFNGREIMPMSFSNFDSLVIKPMDMKIQVVDDRNKVKDVKMIFDGIEQDVFETEDENIWRFPIINNDYYLPEIHTYQIKAKDNLKNVGTGEEIKICSIMGNSPPILYGYLTGPTSGKTNNKNVYSVELIDFEGDDVYYRFNWGDNSETIWEGPIKTIAVSNSFDSLDKLLIKIESEHQWRKPGKYTISVEVKDSQGNHGLYNLSLDVTMNKKIRNKSIIDMFHEANVFSFFKKIFSQLLFWY